MLTDVLRNSNSFFEYFSNDLLSESFSSAATRKYPTIRFTGENDHLFLLLWSLVFCQRIQIYLSYDLQLRHICTTSIFCYYFCHGLLFY